MQNTNEIEKRITDAEKELTRLDSKRAEILKEIKKLKYQRDVIGQGVVIASSHITPSVTNLSSPEEKIALFRSLFKGREDVYPKRFESLRTGKKGYQPVCRNEWIK